MKTGIAKKMMCAVSMAVLLAGASLATAFGAEGGPGTETGAPEMKMDPSMGKTGLLGPGSGPGAAGAAGAVFTTRYAYGGLPLYEGMSDTGNVLTTLPEGTRMTLLEGPYDIYAKVRVEGSGQEGWVKYAYLKSENAVVNAPGVYTYEEMEEDIWALRDRNPALLQVEITGTTPDGRNLYHLIVGSPFGSQDKKKIFINAGIHAREHANPKLVMEQLEMCLDTWNTGKFHGRPYSELFSNVEFHVVPMVNPDGIAISQHGENGIRSPRLRETIRQSHQDDLGRGRASADYNAYLRTWKANGRGVDLNQNFPANFGYKRTIQTPATSSYPGPSALSEPESQNLVNLVERYNPYVSVNYHSMGQVIYWDVEGSPYRERNREFANYMAGVTGYGKMPAEPSIGGFLDWQLLRDVPTYSVTLETGSVACPFPDSEYANVWVKNYLVWPAVAEFALTH